VKDRVRDDELQPDLEDPLWDRIAEVLDPEAARPDLRVLDGGKTRQP
jgi:hypothetical protein